MVVLTEQIEIPASYEKLKAWTANFEEEFVKWSPYHIECNLYNGNYNAVCMACAALIGKAAKKHLSKKLLAVVGAAAFAGAILAVILIAQTPMPL